MVIIQQQISPFSGRELRSKFIYFALACVISLCTLHANALTTLKASIDRNPVMVGETFNLSVIADDSLPRNALDTKELLKQFVVGQTSTSSNTQIINGVMTRQTTWNVALMSRRAGDFVIPALTANNVSSAPLNVKIIKQSPSTQKSQEVKLETSLSQTSVYIGQPLIYEIKLLIGSRLQRAQLQPPTLSASEVSQIGEDEDSSEIVDGKRYRTITRKYNISPSQAGTFELQGALFKGDINQYGYGRSKPVTLIGDNQKIIVKPIPANFPGQWLVSDMVVIEDKWSDDTQYRVGEPITRTITLSAANVSVEQMPELIINSGKSLQSYPDKPISKQGLNGVTLISQTIQKVALIPTVSGDLTVPETKVAWFNAKTEQVNWATLAAKVIKVQPAKQSSTSNKDVQPAIPVIDKGDLVEKVTQTATPLAPAIANNQWKYISWGLMVLLALTWAVIIFKILRATSLPVTTEKSVKSSSEYYDTLVASLKNNDLTNVIRLVPLWLKTDLDTTLDAPSVQTVGITKHYNQLSQSLFSRDVTHYDCSALLSAVSALENQKKTTSKMALNGLYKH